MRRFFIFNLERLLNVLTVLAILAVLGFSARIALDAQGNTTVLLEAAVILLGGFLAIFSVAGCAYLAIGMHENSRRMVTLLARGGKQRELRATRAPAPVAEFEDYEEQPLDDLPEAEPAAGPAPASTPASARTIFSGRAMPKNQPAEPVMKKAPEPAPSPEVSAHRGPRLVADRRPPR